MPADAMQLMLPATSHYDDCKDFVAALGAAKGRDIDIIATNCTKMNARFAQLLLLAARSWAMDSHAFRILNPSEAFETALHLLGMYDVLLQNGSTV